MPDETTASGFQDQSCPQRLHVKFLNAYLWLHGNNDKGYTISMFWIGYYIYAPDCGRGNCNKITNN